MIRKALLVAPAVTDIPELILGPGSVYNIRTNKDHSHTVHYSLLQGAGIFAIDTGLSFVRTEKQLEKLVQVQSLFGILIFGDLDTHSHTVFIVRRIGSRYGDSPNFMSNREVIYFYPCMYLLYFVWV